MAEARGVLDSNLLATALVSPHGPGNALLNAARLDRFRLVVSPEMLAEVRSALVGDFDVAPEDAEQLLALLRRIGDVQAPSVIAMRSRDARDDHVLALAEEAGAIFLATYDHDLMAVGTVGACGIVHPLTALQLVRNLNLEDWDEGIPGTEPEDRSRWREEQGGPAFDAASRFVHYARGLPRSRTQLVALVAQEVWSDFQTAIASGTMAKALTNLAALSRTVRYPADGVAYVFGVPQAHPEEPAPPDLYAPAAMVGAVITLQRRNGHWLIRAVGPAVPPSELGAEAY